MFVLPRLTVRNDVCIRHRWDVEFSGIEGGFLMSMYFKNNRCDDEKIKFRHLWEVDIDVEDYDARGMPSGQHKVSGLMVLSKEFTMCSLRTAVMTDRESPSGLFTITRALWLGPKKTEDLYD